MNYNVILSPNPYHPQVLGLPASAISVLPIHTILIPHVLILACPHSQLLRFTKSSNNPSVLIIACPHFHVLGVTSLVWMSFADSPYHNTTIMS